MYGACAVAVSDFAQRFCAGGWCGMGIIDRILVAYRRDPASTKWGCAFGPAGDLCGQTSISLGNHYAVMDVAHSSNGVETILVVLTGDRVFLLAGWLYSGGPQSRDASAQRHAHSRGKIPGPRSLDHDFPTRYTGGAGNQQGV